MIEDQRKYINDRLEKIGFKLHGTCLMELSRTGCLYVFEFTDEESIIDEMAHDLLHYVYTIEDLYRVSEGDDTYTQNLWENVRPKLQQVYAAITGSGILPVSDDG